VLAAAERRPRDPQGEEGNVAKEFMNFFLFLCRLLCGALIRCPFFVSQKLRCVCPPSYQKTLKLPRQNFRRRERIQKMLHTFCARAANRTVVVGKNVSSSSGGGRTTSRSTTTSSSSAVWVRARQRRISPSSWSSKKGSTLRRFSTAAARTSTKSNNGDEESETRKQSSHKIAPTILQNRLVRPERIAVQRNFSSSNAAAAGASPSPPPTNAAEDKNEQTTQTLMLHNTMSRKKEIFKPRAENGNKVQMYVCGVTVYDYSHIGHARVYVAFDVLYRTLRQLGYDVTYCRNFTDIDDKIINRANESGTSCEELTEKFIQAFHEDMEALGCLRPDLEPRATQHVGDIIDLITRLIEKNHAYAVDGDVYFSVDSLSKYGSLSGRNQEDNRAGERVVVDGRKKNPADFALWKTAKPNEPVWESPWGNGRPGWHIECSAMIEKLLGPVIDIHGGGQDLVFPHHENELAQSSAACDCEIHKSEDKKFVRYWVHNGFVKVDSEKMSKSLGNFFTIREVLARYHPMVLRFMLLGAHYRAPINYTQKALEESSDRLYYIYQTLLDARAALELKDEEFRAELENSKLKLSPLAADAKKLAEETKVSVAQALYDDLNTPLAIASLSGPLKTTNDFLTTKAGKKAVGRLSALSSLVSELENTLSILGLPTAVDKSTSILAELKALALKRAGLEEKDLEALMAQRANARAAKNFEESDRLREELASKGIGLMDGGGGDDAWRPIVPAEM